MNSISFKKFDFVSILIVSILIIVGLVNIYSSTYFDNMSFFSFKNPFGKQLIFTLISLIIFLFILVSDDRFFFRYSSIIYLLGIVLLIAVLIFGNEVKGAKSWFSLLGFSLQPSEFMKPITALALAKYLSNINSDLKRKSIQLYSFLIVLIPIFLVIIQPDPGTALIYFSFFFVLYVIGLPSIYMNIFIWLTILFITTIIFGKQNILFIMSTLIISILLIYIYRKLSFRKFLLYGVLSLIFILCVDFIFNEVFEQRHRDRFDIVLGIKEDNKGIGYNTNQSQLAFKSGGFFGEGFLKGTQTKGDFVPEQHSDYIFATVGEEWGFFGSILTIILFTILILRMINRANTNRNMFNKIVIYSVASIFFFQFAINISMVIGVFPTVGIPLPFISYGGSSLLASIILFGGYIKLDSVKKEKW
ncbi:MAG: rod shape-determining protein RodA [Bacteroidota bacterium]|nr:rod shape-determining protein RodA [Bacteroidota bacterium]MEC8367125.1 rod shape-determining protein RodA [Bacteroidota bacterium]MEC8602230.1 rod shape-determining protein RodA [Bacteroidota bacterium]